MTIDWQRFAEVIQSHERFLLTSHIRPDCDALGSELGMAGLLEALGKQVMILNGQRTPPNLAFLDPGRRIQVVGEDVKKDELSNIDLLMVLDTSAWVQLGAMAEVVRDTEAKKVIVDHHVSEDDLGAESFKDTVAEATGRLVADAAEQLGVALTPQMAESLYAAIATDTGWFRFASTNSGTYRTAAKLVDAGASPDNIFRQLYEQETAARVRLRGVILARAQTELAGRLAHTYVLQQDFQQTGALPSDTEDVINMVLAIQGVEFALILVEQKAGGFKLSFRSRCNVEASAMAEQFDGGGHKAAAGATISGSFEDAQPRVLDAVREAMR